MEKLAAGSAADPENPPPTTESPEIDESAYSSQPSQNQNVDHSTSGNRDLYHHPKYSILRKAALNGVWEEAKNLLDEDPLMLAAVITDECETALHVATGASQTLFVTEIIQRMEPKYLKLRDGNENTALTIAAIVGNIDIASVLLEKNPKLLKIRDSKGMTPLHLAVLLRKNEMAMFLYHKSTGGYLTFEDRTELFFQSIKSDLYDLALKLVKGTSVLAVLRDRNGDTALHVLARKPSSIFDQEMIKSIGNQESMSTPAVQLLNYLWNEVSQNFMYVKEQITEPSNLLSDAARSGNFRFLEELISSYPSFVHESDENGQTIFHVAILHRQTSVFNLIHKIGFRKEIIDAHTDYDDNTILHLAAKYSNQSPNQSSLSSAALEMQNELIEFQEFEKSIQPSLWGVKNRHGLTPRDLFAKEHTCLQQSGAQWMNNTANSCSLVATLIATVVFAAAFTVPGGTDSKTGTPFFLKKTLFRVFAISDAIALSFSSFSILMFLSILTSGYTQSQFYRSLPLKLLIGLLTLFISIIFMMITFSSTYFLLYNDQSLCIPALTVVFVSIPIIVFVLLHYHLLRNIFYLTHRSGFLPKLGFLFNK